MAVLLNIPQGLTNKQLKTMRASVDKVIKPNDAILMKNVSFMFDDTLEYVYSDTDIKETSVVTVVFQDDWLAFNHGIDYNINVKSGNVVFTANSIPSDDVGTASVNVTIRIVNI